VKKHGYAVEFVEGVAAGRSDVVIRLAQLRHLVGRVTHGGNGQPATEFTLVARAVVEEGKNRPRWMNLPSVHEGFVSLDGRYSVWIRPGVHRIRAETPTGGISATQVVTIPIVGEPPPLELRVWDGGAIRGCVMIRGRAAKQQVRVRIYRQDDDRPQCVGSVQTDGEGGFAFASLRPGKYLVVGSHHPLSGPHLEGANSVRLVAARNERISLHIGEGTAVRVRVRRRSGQPVEAARVAFAREDRVPIASSFSELKTRSEYVLAHQRNGSSPDAKERAKFLAEARRRRAVTDANGRISSVLLIPGRYILKVTAKGLRTCERLIQIGPGAYQEVEVVLNSE
jgi:hypothetical protein